MKNLYTAFLCILGMLSALTQGHAKDFSGRPDAAFTPSIARDDLRTNTSNDSLTNNANHIDSAIAAIGGSGDSLANTSASTHGLAKTSPNSATTGSPANTTSNSGPS